MGLVSCRLQSDTTKEEYRIYPDYPKGKPDELEGIELDLNEIRI